MLRVAGANQEDRYQSGGLQNTLIWQAVKYDASLTNKHPDCTFADYELALEAAGQSPPATAI